MIEKILTILDGNKTYLTAIALITIPFLVLKGLIDPDTGAYLGAIIGVLAGSGKFATEKVLGKAKRNGEENEA